MVSRPTVADVAREAGVSVATVDRVVNARLPVREDTTRRVLEAAQKLGFHATGLIRSRLREQLPEYRRRPAAEARRPLLPRVRRAARTGDHRQPVVPRRRPFDYWIDDDPTISPRGCAGSGDAVMRWRWLAPTIRRSPRRSPS